MLSRRQQELRKLYWWDYSPAVNALRSGQTLWSQHQANNKTQKIRPISGMIMVGNQKGIQRGMRQELVNINNSPLDWSYGNADPHIDLALFAGIRTNQSWISIQKSVIEVQRQVDLEALYLYRHRSNNASTFRREKRRRCILVVQDTYQTSHLQLDQVDRCDYEGENTSITHKRPHHWSSLSLNVPTRLEFQAQSIISPDAYLIFIYPRSLRCLPHRISLLPHNSVSHRNRSKTYLANWRLTSAHTASVWSQVFGP